jgi:hypothetical protein
MSTFTELRNIIDRAFENAETYTSKLTDELINMPGMSGKKTRHFYNNLLNNANLRYLEIGTWMGSTVCSAMCKNKATIVCIDNWSEFGGPKQEFLTYFDKYKGDNEAKFIESDCFKLDTSSLGKFNIYMYDGDHSRESHYKALTYYYYCLDDIFIFIVDDWNWQAVRDGTLNAINDLQLNILFSKQIRLTSDGSHTPELIARETWHNGIYVAVLQKHGKAVRV